VVVVGSKVKNLDYWGPSTGFLLEGISRFPDYIMTTKVDKTNSWETQQAGLDPKVFYAIAAVIVLAVAVAIILVARRRKK